MRALSGEKLSMKNEIEQSLGSLHFERFAMLSASAAGLSWNTYKNIDFTVNNVVDLGELYFHRKSCVTLGSDK